MDLTFVGRDMSLIICIEVLLIKVLEVSVLELPSDGVSPFLISGGPANFADVGVDFILPRKAIKMFC